MPNKKMKVLLISPQHWGTMRVTKHHYAIELAKLGHEVYFLEPTEASWKWNQTSFSLNPSDAEGVQLVQQQINVPYNLKFHLKGLFDWFIKRHIKKLEKQLGPFDLVWSFDLSNAMPLLYFSKKSRKIFFAADWPQVPDAVKAADGSDILVSVAQEILDQYPNTPNTKKLLIEHGVAECFIEEGKKPFVKTDEVIRIGMSGNFLRPDIDRPVLLEIIKTHTDLLFECFGAYEFKNSNLGGSADADTKAFIEDLQNAPNVILHGMVRPEELAKELRRMDVFLICYDVEKDQSKGTNYHKVMEYLAYGRPIVSNEISSYKTPIRQGLISMPRNEMSIIEVFKYMINFLKTSEINQSSKMQDLSRSKTYSINLLNVINACAEL
jgi:glycosyltransferase involved in cell wall biosynthesis